MIINDDQAEMIVRAIVNNAVDDYTRCAMKVRHRFNPPFRGYDLRTVSVSFVRQMIKDGIDAEAFLLSDDFTGLTGLDGVAVVEELSKMNFIYPGYFNRMQEQFLEIYGGESNDKRKRKKDRCGNL